jgi:porin
MKRDEVTSEPLPGKACGMPISLAAIFSASAPRYVIALRFCGRRERVTVKWNKEWCRSLRLALFAGARLFLARQAYKKIKFSLCLLLVANSATFTGNSAKAQEGSSNLFGLQNVTLPEELQPSIASSFPVLADFKLGLFDLGYNLQFSYFADGLGNPSGGVKQGAAYEGILYMVLDADLAKIVGLNGLSFRINAYQIHGRELSKYNLYNLATVDNIEAWPTTRLFELWVEQKMGDFASIRIGQLTADNQFFISEYGHNLYINNTFGWPVILASDLPGGGGPNYPLTTPGLRFQLNPSDHLALLAGLYNGDPAGSGFTGMQEIKDPAGINFRLKDPPLLMVEGQYTYNQDKSAQGLAGTIKLGGWYHFGPFDDEHLSFDGQSLALPADHGLAKIHSGDFGLYGVIDQMLWHLPDDPKKGVGAFGRVAVAPSDRNLIDFYAEAGANFMGLWQERPDDSFGVAANFSQLSPSVVALDNDRNLISGIPLPVRDYELVAELTYQAQIIPGWIVQPDFQYIFHPGGGTIDPVNPSIGRIPDAVVFLLRTQISF